MSEEEVTYSNFDKCPVCGGPGEYQGQDANGVIGSFFCLDDKCQVEWDISFSPFKREITKSKSLAPPPPKGR